MFNSHQFNVLESMEMWDADPYRILKMDLLFKLLHWNSLSSILDAYNTIKNAIIEFNRIRSNFVSVKKSQNTHHSRFPIIIHIFSMLLNKLAFSSVLAIVLDVQEMSSINFQLNACKNQWHVIDQMSCLTISKWKQGFSLHGGWHEHPIYSSTFLPCISSTY